MVTLWGKVQVHEQRKMRVDPVPKYTLKRPREQHPLKPITASAFTADLHKLARRYNGALSYLEECPSNIVELPEYFTSLKPLQVAASFKACIASTMIEELDSRGLLTREEAKGLVANLVRSIAVAQDKLIEAGCEVYWSKQPGGVIFKAMQKDAEKKALAKLKRKKGAA